MSAPDPTARRSDLRVVVTGAGRGIGAALARKLAREGARVVVNDIDPDTTRAVAEEIGGLAWPGDSSSADGSAALIAAAHDHLGEIDVFFANAGVDVSAGLEATDDQWAKSFDVNVMAHVRAARLLIPRWLNRDGGRFVVTASAAGLLTALQTAPYATSKHASVGFAEWLSITYGDHGIVVQAICPEGVRTEMVANASAAATALVRGNLMEPDDLADTVWAALDGDDFFILPHPRVSQRYLQKAQDHQGWIRTMRGVQKTFEAPV